MRSLNTSLPGTSPSKQANDNPEDLLSAFRAAALQVTKLYKTASSEQGRARTEGYQDALDELLVFLDKENIGLNDGEGWRIRRWATERLDGRNPAPQSAESDEETSERTSSRSPVLSRSHIAPRTQSIPRSVRTASPEQQSEPAPPVHTVPASIPEVEEEEPTPEIASLPVLPQSTFNFRSQHTYPQDADMIISDINSTERTLPHRTPSAIPHATNPRATNQNSRTNARRQTNRGAATIGRGAGQKRKTNFDFSDFFGIDLGKDRQAGGGKRGRYA